GRCRSKARYDGERHNRSRSDPRQPNQCHRCASGRKSKEELNTLRTANRFFEHAGGSSSLLGTSWRCERRLARCYKCRQSRVDLRSRDGTCDPPNKTNLFRITASGLELLRNRLKGIDSLI